MRELSVFVDESGGQSGHSKYYLLTLVFHDQGDDIAAQIKKHAIGLHDRRLKDIPFHAGPLMTGHGDYEGMDLKMRKSYFQLFFIDLQHLPIRYRTFIYKRSELRGDDGLVALMRRDIANLLFDNLSYFQQFDHVKIYYDDGQAIVAKALRAAFEYALSRESVLYRKAYAADFMLFQAADMLCALELTSLKFRNKEASRTDEKMFGSAGAFKNNYMKAVKRKRLK